MGEAKVSCILRHWGVQLILAYSWARPATFVAGKDRGGMILLLLFFSPLWFEPRSGHMWESQVLLTDGQVVFLRVLRFSPTFDERSARYKWNILERAVKPKSKKKTKKKTKKLLLFLHLHSFSSFPVTLFHLLYYLFYLSSPFLWERHKMTHKGWRVVKPQHNQKIIISLLKHILLVLIRSAGLGGSVGCAVQLETRSRVRPPPRSVTFFCGDWSWNIFYGHSLPSADSRRAVVSFWRKNVHNTG